MEKRYFYKETGMYIDWAQLDRLPEIDTLVDIGVGPIGTPDLYQRFKTAKLVLIDPLDEAKNYADSDSVELKGRDVNFYQTALGNVDQKTEVLINVEEQIGRSTLMQVANINFEGDPIEKRTVPIQKLDDLIVDKDSLGWIGMKIDTEGYELEVIRGASAILKKTRFILAEVRHNHESFDGVYKLHEFVQALHKNGFVLTMILTAKPFIADLCFQPVSDLQIA